MVLGFWGSFGPIFPASREIPNFDLRFTINRKTQRFLVLLGSLIGMMHMVKYRIRFWNFLQRLYFLCFFKRYPKRFKILPIVWRLGSWGSRYPVACSRACGTARALMRAEETAER